jgi:hypothetical protein
VAELESADLHVEIGKNVMLVKKRKNEKKKKERRKNIMRPYALTGGALYEKNQG